MHEALLYQKLDDGRVECQLCAHGCVIAPGERSRCGVRLNDGGTLYTLSYQRAAAINVDHIEKKPLFHFLPGSTSLSIGTLGCNFRCDFCQNWQMSRGAEDQDPREQRAMELSPQGIVEHCVRRKIPSISYTYNEPTVFFEYALETAKLSQEWGLKNTFVSNGFQSEQAVELLAPYLDGINIDLKSFSDEFYQEHCQARLEPVLGTIERMKGHGIWVEVTTLVIPGLNDSDEELKSVARFLAGVDRDIPWHLTAFHPDYLLTARPHTQPAALFHGYDLGKEAGLRHVYVGNIIDVEHSTTWCPRCGSALIGRYWHDVRLNRMVNGRCTNCDEQIAGVWA